MSASDPTDPVEKRHFYLQGVRKKMGLVIVYIVAPNLIFKLTSTLLVY